MLFSREKQESRMFDADTFDSRYHLDVNNEKSENIPDEEIVRESLDNDVRLEMLKVFL